MTNTEAIKALDEVKAGLLLLNHLFDDPKPLEPFLKVSYPEIPNKCYQQGDINN